ncbi:hypothetical protein [Pedosphaera parvula]|uniref:Uncharacterized protein n=1 Tax=Pedosphaera parvula (strain Ellin514) TaxID=320771 RepID=B9XJA5_PEDPL|nr:hypothetical protein [Pedosphaera parvula]EEF60143.1 conserved hypothetical protein [Pedosphaera parvula Ellin514]
MNLRLQYPPTPENAAALAQLAVDAARNVDSIELDYSPRSLADVDGIIGRFHSEKLTPGQIGSTIFSFGCYVGEVLVRHQGGVWKMPEQSIWSKLGFGNTKIMVIETPNGNVWNPIGKAFKLLENGKVDSVSYFYAVVSKKAG